MNELHEAPVEAASAMEITEMEMLVTGDISVEIVGFERPPAPTAAGEMLALLDTDASPAIPDITDFPLPRISGIAAAPIEFALPPRTVGADDAAMQARINQPMERAGAIEIELQRSGS